MPKGSGLTKPLTVSPELATLVGAKKDEKLSRPQVVKRLWAYIKEKTQKTNNSSNQIKRWSQYLEKKKSELSEWPSISRATSPPKHLRMRNCIL